MRSFSIKGSRDMGVIAGGCSEIKNFCLLGRVGGRRKREEIWGYVYMYS